VGTGFHPELTGRENIFLNGAILGMTKAEIRSKLDEIVAFAGVERYIDTPVKRYSSGMKVRLGFAVAAHLEPEILVVDEVLAVGDAEFQKKAVGKMKDISNNDGRTILFVSHNMTAIKSLCNKGIVLKNGSVDFSGNEKDAVKHYLFGENKEFIELEKEWKEDVSPGNTNVKLRKVKIIPENNSYLDTDTAFTIQLDIENYIDNKNIDCSIRIVTSDEIIVFTAGAFLNKNRDSVIANYKVSYKIPAFLLNAGYYKIDIIIGENQKYLLAHFPSVISFEIHNTLTGRGINMNRAPGIIKPIINTSVQIKSI
jgi:lipopolysaccharide transport system ATP-binding protein